MTAAKHPAVVRPARGDDWEGLWPLLVGTGQVDDAARARQRFQRVLGHAAECLPAHRRAGHSAVRLNDLFVAPVWRRQGVGSQLFAAVLRWATERDADWLEWHGDQARLAILRTAGLHRPAGA